MKERSVRTAMLLGRDAVDRLQTAHVAVFGIGGVGSFTAESLARAGVGALTLVDDDTVSESNLNRQLVALRSTIGMAKTEVMAARIRDINPDCQVTEINARYTPQDRELFFGANYDFIADAIDSVACKTDLIVTALERNIPIISAMGTGNKLDPSQFLITDLAKTAGCPLARVMRRELKQRGILHHTVLYSTEPARKPLFQPDEAKVVPGSVAWVPSCAGLMIAGHIIRHLTGQI